ncbi:hypothetical protein Mapa_014133 [Marchantia paleacea]|nr:hypothetical protein Mapa_014133 [Marchantia paleacea]
MLKTTVLLQLISVMHLTKAGSASAHQEDHGRSLWSDFEPEPLVLTYRGGELLSGSSIPVYIIWYGRFSDSQRAMIHDFFGSFDFFGAAGPTVKGWWGLTQGYKDARSSPVASTVRLEQERSDDSYSMGRYLSEDHIEGLLVNFLNENPAAKRHDAFYLVLTSDDVYVEGFCTRRCASHFSTRRLVYMTPAKPSQSPGQGAKLALAWVGNSAFQCPGILPEESMVWT